jgi:hypothetical protein
MHSNVQQLALEFVPRPKVRRVSVSSAALTRDLARPTRIEFTNNSSTMLSARIRQGTLVLRAHHMFEDLTEEMYKAFVQYLNGNARAGKLVDQYIADNRHRIEPSERRRRVAVNLSACGEYHDLDALMARVLAQYFPELEPPRVGWGKRTRRKGRTMRLASYDPELHLIRVHPRLDRKLVPEFEMEMVLYHELCHAYLAKTRSKEAGLRHDKAFRNLETRHHDFKRSLEWEKKNLHKI